VAAPSSPRVPSCSPWASEHRVAFLLLAAGFTLAYGIMTVIAVHLLTLRQSQGFALAAAVGFGAPVGPSQVWGRILEMASGRKAHPSGACLPRPF
jgi:hypothetical protein